MGRLRICKHGIVGISKCKTCTRLRKRRWMQQKDQAERSRIRARKRLGCVDPTGETKHGPCEICNRPFRLYYDHDHLTGKFRGWLCNDCNTKLDWSIKYSNQIEDYLRKQYGD